MAAATSLQAKFILLLLVSYHCTELCEGWWFIPKKVVKVVKAVAEGVGKAICKPVVAVSCRVVSQGGGAAIGAGLGGPAGAAAGAALGTAVAETCEPFSKSICPKRRRGLISPAEFKEFDKTTKVYRFPQFFSDYKSENGKISFDAFIKGIESVLPVLHMHHYSLLAETFDKADLNDDGELDRDEFAKGPWILEADEVNDLKRELMDEELADELKREMNDKAMRNERNPDLSDEKLLNLLELEMLNEDMMTEED